MNTHYWLLDPRFDFLLPWYEVHYQCCPEDILLVGSCHGDMRKGRNTLTLGTHEAGCAEFYEPEDVNALFAQRFNPSVAASIIPFTGENLPMGDNIHCVLATGQTAAKWNNKWEQYQLFSALGLHTPETTMLHDLGKASEACERWLMAGKSAVIKLPNLSGGYQMAVISDQKSLDEYRYGKTFEQTYLVSEYIPHERSFAGMGLVRRDGNVESCGVTEQVLYRDVAYEGMIWPAELDAARTSEIEEATVLVGRSLAEDGYFGYYNVDYLLGSDGKLYALEINARFGFGTLLFALQCGSRFWDVMEGAALPDMTVPNSRMILGKLKGEFGRSYAGLTSCGDIVSWYDGKIPSFEACYIGTDAPTVFSYGSYIGLFGEWLPLSLDRDAVLRRFWAHCLKYYKEEA